MSTDGTPVRSVGRAIDILIALTQGPQSLGRLADRVQLSKATVHRLLASLGHSQLVIQDPTTGDYLLGPGCFILADAVMRGLGGLGIISRPVLETLSRVSGETVTLHVRTGTQRLCVEELVSQQSVRYTAGVGATAPMHVGAAGKLLLAFSEDQDRERVLATAPLDAITDETVTDRATLEQELESIRTAGYAQSRGERVEGAAAISAPVFSGDGEILAALSILGPAERLSEARTSELRPALLDAAQEISGLMAMNDTPKLTTE